MAIFFDIFRKKEYSVYMKRIIAYPDFEPISAHMHDELYPLLNTHKAGISEFTFLSLYLHQKKYAYKISYLFDSTYVLTGIDKKGTFFCVLGKIPEVPVLQELLEKYTRWKHIDQNVIDANSSLFEKLGVIPEDDRDSADYLYSREKLASLSGKSLHKKRNLANNFEKSYECEVKFLDVTTAADAGHVLDEWQKMRAQDGNESDYEQCFFALSLLPFTEQHGWVIYAESKPVGWALGEYVADGEMFVVHFEKGLDEYKGVYQYVNRATAQSLSEKVLYINREQDLGDEGLRQAKMTYRPIGFVQKYRVEIKKG